jgi:putative SOS response-associated peptidase YedK
LCIRSSDRPIRTQGIHLVIVLASREVQQPEFCTMIIGGPSKFAADIYDRCRTFLVSDQIASWLSGEVGAQVLKPVAAPPQRGRSPYTAYALWI